MLSGPGHWVPASEVYTKEQDGLSSPWFGMVFMNPPFGGRNGHVPWLKKFIKHGNGIAIVIAYTSSKWFQELVPQVDAVLFPQGKTKFLRTDGTVGKQPGSGVVLLGIGKRAVLALEWSFLGFFIDLRKNDDEKHAALEKFKSNHLGPVDTCTPCPNGRVRV